MEDDITVPVKVEDELIAPETEIVPSALKIIGVLLPALTVNAPPPVLFINGVTIESGNEDNRSLPLLLGATPLT